MMDDTKPTKAQLELAHNITEVFDKANATPKDALLSMLLVAKDVQGELSVKPETKAKLQFLYAQAEQSALKLADDLNIKSTDDYPFASMEDIGKLTLNQLRDMFGAQVNPKMLDEVLPKLMDDIFTIEGVRYLDILIAGILLIMAGLSEATKEYHDAVAAAKAKEPAPTT